MVDWKKLGFEESTNWAGEKEFCHEDCLLHFQEENGFLTIYSVMPVGWINHEARISDGEIPATTKSVRQILKALHIKVPVK